MKKALLLLIPAVMLTACPKKDPLAKIAKDTAAAAVLIRALGAIIIGIMIMINIKITDKNNKRRAVRCAALLYFIYDAVTV